MKSIKKYIPFVLGLMVFLNISCHRNDDEADDFPQEEMSNILLFVKDKTDTTIVKKQYNFQINGSSFLNIQLINGHTYEVEVQFKNGVDDMNGDILSAKDEHFLIYDFPNSDISLTRLDGGDLRTDGLYVGLKTQWTVNNAANNSSAQLILTLYHASEPSSVSDVASPSGTGKVYGKQSGGETDAKAIYKLSN